MAPPTAVTDTPPRAARRPRQALSHCTRPTAAAPRTIMRQQVQQARLKMKSKNKIMFDFSFAIQARHTSLTKEFNILIEVQQFNTCEKHNYQFMLFS